MAHLADHLDVVKAFEGEHGSGARADLMALYHADPEQFVEAVAGIQSGEGAAVRSTLGEWARAQPGVWDEQSKRHRER